MLKILSMVALIFATNLTYADDGSDRIRTKDGASCESSVNTGKRMYTEVYGSDGEYSDDVGIRLGVEIELGQTKRMNCNRLFELEVKRKEMELKLQEAELELRMLDIQKRHRDLTDRRRDF